MEPPGESTSPSHSWAIVPYREPPINALLKKLVTDSFELQKREYETFHKPASVTVLLGTSSVGKSSTIAQLRESNPQLDELGADLIRYRRSIQYIKETHPEIFEFLDTVLKPKANEMHILDAVQGNVFHFKESISSEEQEKAKKLAPLLTKGAMEAARISTDDIVQIMLDEALCLSASQTPVIFDILNIENVFAHTIGRMHPTVALLYVPLSTLVKRIISRNAQAIAQENLSEVRLGISPLFQFAMLFRPTTSKEDTLFTISKKEVTKAFDALYDEWQEKEKMKIPKEKRAEDLQEVLHVFGFTDPSTKKLSYTPRYRGYDCIIDTSQVDAKTAAAILSKRK